MRGRLLLATLLLVALSAAAAVTSGAHPFNGQRAANACVVTQNHSLVGTTTARITWVNKTTAPVKIYWLDYHGKRVFYEDVAAGRSFVQTTWVTHAWVVLDPAGHCIGYAVATATPQTYVITGSAAPITTKAGKGAVCGKRHLNVVFNSNDPGGLHPPAPFSAKNPKGRCWVWTHPVHANGLSRCQQTKNGDPSWAYNEVEPTDTKKSDLKGVTACAHSLPGKIHGYVFLAVCDGSNGTHCPFNYAAAPSLAAAKGLHALEGLELYDRTNIYNHPSAFKTGYFPMINFGGSGGNAAIAAAIKSVCGHLGGSASGAHTIGLYSGSAASEKRNSKAALDSGLVWSALNACNNKTGGKPTG